MAKKNETAAGKARVLVDCEAGKCNTVIQCDDADQLAAWVKAGLVDVSAEGIAAAEAEAG